ncbi:hypothetical protein HU200_036082 [Digitaria exilis]|uniref:Uncharacterized protein n=1 Tax=Digitaria exilis TaxID=1010633 RepID=A0A835BE08_9POAL|nr:hypothetical protein HU200_036082 [Digitaria exilis]
MGRDDLGDEHEFGGLVFGLASTEKTKELWFKKVLILLKIQSEDGGGGDYLSVTAHTIGSSLPFKQERPNPVDAIDEQSVDIVVDNQPLDNVEGLERMEAEEQTVDSVEGRDGMEAVPWQDIAGHAQPLEEEA